MPLSKKLNQEAKLRRRLRSIRHRRPSRSALVLLGAVAGAFATGVIYWLIGIAPDNQDAVNAYDSPYPVSQIMDGNPYTNPWNAVIASDEPILSADLPHDARTWWARQSGRTDTPILIVNTPFGIAFKTESLLFGPCASVEYAYRKIPDTRYQTRCYDSQLETVTMPHERIPMPNLVGANYSEIEPRISRPNPILVRWLPNDGVPTGTILAQSPPSGVSIPEYSPVEVEVSAGGPVVSWPDLPQLLRTRISNSNPYWFQYLWSETYVSVDASSGTAYKADALLFGPCEAVRSAFGTFEDKHYNTLALEPCERIGSE